MIVVLAGAISAKLSYNAYRKSGQDSYELNYNRIIEEPETVLKHLPDKNRIEYKLSIINHKKDRNISLTEEERKLYLDNLSHPFFPDDVITSGDFILTGTPGNEFSREARSTLVAMGFLKKPTPFVTYAYKQGILVKILNLSLVVLGIVTFSRFTFWALKTVLSRPAKLNK